MRKKQGWPRVRFYQDFVGFDHPWLVIRVGGGCAEKFEVRGEIRGKILLFYQGFELDSKSGDFLPTRCSTKCLFEFFKLFKVI